MQQTLSHLTNVRTGDTFTNYTILRVVSDQLAGTHGDKNLYYVILTADGGRTAYDAYEITPGPSQLAPYQGATAPIVVISPGRGDKYSWIKLDEKATNRYQYPQANGFGQPPAAPPATTTTSAVDSHRDNMYLARDAYRMAVDFLAATNKKATKEEVDELATHFAYGAQQLAHSLSI